MATSAVPKELKSMVKEAQDNGWELSGGGRRHFKLSKGGTIIVMASSGSDWRGVHQTRARLRRVGAIR